MPQLIKLNSNSFLRPHPYLDPITSPTPVLHNEFKFPGDELVLYHKVSLPNDLSLGAIPISAIQLISAKCSVIAEKKNIFSEQFSEAFQSTRTFILDSFVTQFGSLNAPNIPWGVAGADGYAHSLQTIEQRNFKLPDADFRKQIKFFTTHTNGTTHWEYWFQFPVLLRWEYWIGLLSASNYFFDTTKPQNNKNHWWFHYYVAGIWNIISRLEIEILVYGVPTTVRCDLNLTPTPATGIGAIYDYNSNPDYVNEYIKTSVVHGTPSNTPCLIKDNEDTEVFVYFKKNSAWALGQKDNISIVISIEPFEGSGVTALTRASSLYPITPESVFRGLDLSLTNDSGLGVQTDTGDYIVIDGSSNGVQQYFDGSDDTKVLGFGLIDHVKLNAIYPGVIKFRLYARLYDKTVDTGVSPEHVMMGEKIYQDATLVSVPDSISFDANCPSNKPHCPFNLNVFGDKMDVNPLHNDKTDFYTSHDAFVSAITMTLQKNTNSCGGAWIDKATIVDSTLGNFFAFGLHPDFSGSAFMDDYGKKYTGVFLEWRKVLNAFGAGQYRMKIIKTTVLSTTIDVTDEKTFCLREYHCNLANGTVRIETVNRGSRGSLSDKTLLTDYATGWNSEIRLSAVIKYTSSKYIKESTEYGDQENNVRRNYINEQQARYTLSIKPVPGWMDWIINTNIIQADEILITDFNLSNRHKLVALPVMNDGDYTPRDNNLRNPLSDVDVSLIYSQNNLRMRQSR